VDLTCLHQQRSRLVAAAGISQSAFAVENEAYKNANTRVGIMSFLPPYSAQTLSDCQKGGV
jgi:hypothetical protein